MTDRRRDQPAAEHGDLQVQMKTIFQKDKVPVFCRTTLIMPVLARGLKERLIGLVTS
ncbi:MAG: hypothetical protein ACLUV8_13660 [Clostridium sp.]